MRGPMQARHPRAFISRTLRDLGFRSPKRRSHSNLPAPSRFRKLTVSGTKLFAVEYYTSELYNSLRAARVAYGCELRPGGVLMRPVVCVFLFWLGVAVCSGAGRQVTDSARLASGLAIDLTYPSEAPPKAAQIMVHVSDPDGLDDLTITSVSEDLRYQTNLSGSQPTRELRRVFALTDLF